MNSPEMSDFASGVRSAKKMRRRTVAEILFDELPMFSDTEDELECEDFTQENFLTYYKKSLNNKHANADIIISTNPRSSWTFNDNCKCCQINKLLLSSDSLSHNLHSTPTMTPPLSSDGRKSLPNSRLKRKRNLQGTDSPTKSVHHRNVLANKDTNSKVNQNDNLLSKKTPKKSTKEKSRSKGNGQLQALAGANGCETRNESNGELHNGVSDFETLLREIEMRKNNMPPRSSTTNISGSSRRDGIYSDSDIDVYQSYIGPTRRSKSIGNTSKRRKSKSKGKQPSVKKSDYKFVDKKIFKVPIDTTKNRQMQSALLRKLGRSGGGSFDAEPLNLQHEDFRSFQTTKQKPKKLYDPEEWLNSKEFTRLSLDNI